MLLLNKDVKPNKRKVIQEKMIWTYGNVKLDSMEEKFLQLGPNFAMMEDLDLDKIRTQFMIGLIKIRWGRMGKKEDEIVRYRDLEEIEEEEKIDMISNRERREVDLENNIVSP